MATRQVIALALLLGVASAAPASHVQPLWTYGHAAYTYGPLHCTGSPCDVVPSCNTAHWAKDIEAFNMDTTISNATISTVYSQSPSRDSASPQAPRSSAAAEEDKEEEEEAEELPKKR